VDRKRAIASSAVIALGIFMIVVFGPLALRAEGLLIVMAGVALRWLPKVRDVDR
jgi:hypothetical protein